MSGVRRIAFGEARVAADAIGSLADVYRLALRSCAWKHSVDKHLTPLCGFDFACILQPSGNGGYARLTQAKIPKALRAYHEIQSLSDYIVKPFAHSTGGREHLLTGTLECPALSG